MGELRRKILMDEQQLQATPPDNPRPDDSANGSVTGARFHDQPSRTAATSAHEKVI
jgi:hypothetical protein